MPKQILEMLTAEAVTAGALTLCTEEAPNRYILCAGAGGYASTRLFETEGIFLPPEQQTPESVLEYWEGISDINNQSELKSGFNQSEKFLGKAMAHVKASS